MADISKINAVLLANIAEIDDVLAANIAKVNGLVFTTAPAFTGLLDTYTGAAAAYSTRRLYSLYTGAALRVRRDSDDTEQDIGFDSNGDLDTSALATFVGSGNNGYVTKWYGQESSGGTGSGNDAVQTTNANQPKIYDSSSGVYTENGKPIIKNTPVTAQNRNALEISSQSFTTDNWAFGVCLVEQTFSNWIEGPSGGDYVLLAQSGSGSSAHSGVSGVSLYKDGSSWSATTRGNVYTDLVNNQSLVVANWSSSSWTSFNLGYPSADQIYMHPMQEFVLWTSDQSSNRSGIEGNVNAHFQIGNFGTPTSGLLYDYSGAAAAYSVRQLANTAALAMRIREDGTDTETDIGFDANGDLDTAAIASHCGSNNGYVVTWYDQSGEQKDATQGTSGNQPQIYNGTAVITENGKPALTPGANGDQFEKVATGITGQYAFVVVQTTDALDSIMFSSQNSQSTYVLAAVDGGTFAASDTNRSPTYYKNGSSYSPSNGDSLNTDLQSQTLMAVSYNSFDNHLLGYPWSGGRSLMITQEVIIYNSDQTSNRSGIETNINNYFSIY